MPAWSMHNLSLHVDPLIDCLNSLCTCLITQLFYMLLLDIRITCPQTTCPDCLILIYKIPTFIVKRVQMRNCPYTLFNCLTYPHNYLIASELTWLSDETKFLICLYIFVWLPNLLYFIIASLVQFSTLIDLFF